MLEMRTAGTGSEAHVGDVDVGMCPSQASYRCANATSASGERADNGSTPIGWWVATGAEARATSAGTVESTFLPIRFRWRLLDDGRARWSRRTRRNSLRRAAACRWSATESPRPPPAPAGDPTECVATAC